MAPPFPCPVKVNGLPGCDKLFKKKYNLTRHLERVHPQYEHDVPRKNISDIKCAVCNEHCKNFEDFSKHLLVKHNLSLTIETLEFTDEDSFCKWKKNFEHKNSALFVQKTSLKKLKNDTLVKYFQCHRSGYAVSRVADNQRKRRIKNQGSCKIDGFCPARMKVIYNKNGSIQVEFSKTHFGHDPSLAHLHFKLNDRKNLASKIALNIPSVEISSTIKYSTSKDNLLKIDAIMRQNLHNIEKEFFLNSEGIHRCIETLDHGAWAECWKTIENSSILIYKPLDIFDEKYCVLTVDDFALGIMTPAQAEVIKKFGKNCICIDSTHGMNTYGYELITVMVIHDMRLGFPCGFYISNRMDKNSFDVFFNEIKRVVGMFKTKIFMSNMNEELYNSWQSTIGQAENRLFCIWHVDKDWRKNLTKVRNRDVQRNTYKKLRTLIEETDVTVFHAMMESICVELCEAEETMNFGEYFKKHYANCFSSWAYCYRFNAGIKTNIYLERIHGKGKHTYLNCQTVKALDKAICAVMQFVKNKTFNRLTIMETSKVKIKLKELGQRHKFSLKLSNSLVTPNEDGSWNVTSESLKVPQIYVVCLVYPNCNCKLVCKHCSACLHKYSCTCIDASIKWNMCKHIHLICRTLADTRPNELSPQSEDQLLEIMDYTDCDDRIDNSKEFSHSFSDCCIEEERNQLSAEFNQLLYQVTTLEDVEIVRQTMERLIPQLNAKNKVEAVKLLPREDKIKPKRIIDTQGRIFHIVKPREIPNPMPTITIQNCKISNLQVLFSEPSTS